MAARCTLASTTIPTRMITMIEQILSRPPINWILDAFALLAIAMLFVGYWSGKLRVR